MQAANGRHIIFSTQLDGYVAALWIMDTDGKHPRRLSDPKLTASVPDVSPDGKQVVFNNQQNSPGLSNIFKMNLDGTGVIRLTRPEGKNGGLPVFSPDGRKVLFVSDRESPGFARHVGNGCRRLAPKAADPGRGCRELGRPTIKYSDAF
jgi:Tol biopolymer transport system component